jgi:Tol biopolymer transport system component
MMRANAFRRVARLTFVALFLSIISITLSAQSVDYSVVSVREEAGLDLMKFSSDNDMVAMPMVRRTRAGVNWVTGKIIDVSPDGGKLAFISARGDVSNVFVKDISRQGASIQRTNRNAVQDFSYSPNGHYILFSERVGKNSQIFETDSEEKFVCRQITSGNNDFSPVYSRDMKSIIFARQEVRGISLWAYDLNNKYLSNYSYGMNPVVSKSGEIICSRMNDAGRGEIWKVNFNTGVEECLLTDLNISFSTPAISPDGRWIACVGGTPLSTGKSTYWNTDIYVCRIDGTDRHQLTYHAADDLCPVWSGDGTYIYFVSQRGSAEAIANIWRITFPL